ncbi:MAG: DNA translocase FtsK 4TM domain-containing protein, partial [Arenibacter latericius]|nr:DNA translocase FtsK 4TM domain-containing protein [Arenibacter latericius]
MAKKSKKTRSKTPTKKRLTIKLSKQNKVILGGLLMLLGIALFFSFLSFYFTWQDDQSVLSEFANRNEQAKNLLNKFGANVGHLFIYKGFGVASVIFTYLIFLSGLHLFFSITKKDLFRKWIWGLVFIIWFSIAFGFFANTKPLLGGMVGYEMNDFLQDYGGKVGVFLMLLFGLIVILVRLFQFSPETAVSYLNKKGKSLASELKTDPNTKKQASTTPEITEDEEETITSIEEETPVIVDTYTHKKDIPPLPKEDEDDSFQVNVGTE